MWGAYYIIYMYGVCLSLDTTGCINAAAQTSLCAEIFSRQLLTFPLILRSREGFCRGRRGGRRGVLFALLNK